MAYRCPRISTRTTRSGSLIRLPAPAPPTSPTSLQVQRLDLLEHLGDAGANLFPLFLERRELGRGAVGFRELRLGGLELARQPQVLILGARFGRAHPADHLDQQLDF